LLAALAAAIFCGFCPWTGLSDRDGFAPPRQNLFAPLIDLAPPGNCQSALAAFEQIVALNRQMTLNPAFSPQLQSVIDKLPAPETIPIQMTALYASPDIPWQTSKPDRHYLDLKGRPDGPDYRYGLAQSFDAPNQPGDSEGIVELEPASGRDRQRDSVEAKVKASLYLSGRLTPERAMAAALDFGREVYGTLAPPWDDRPGSFNAHDRAALARFRRDIPALSERVNHYLEIHNLLDEFADASGPWVLFNLNAEIRDGALAPFPHLQRFYRTIAARVRSRSIIRDDAGNRWLLTGYDRGKITVTFILRRGMLTPMTAELKPAGPPLFRDRIRSGRFYVENSVSVQSLGMRFGLTGIRFVNTYVNHDGAIEFHGQMTDVPRLIAPPVIHKVTMLLAGQFLETLAKGNDGQGVVNTFAALPNPRGGTMLEGTFSAELRNAPALALLARMAAALAPAQDQRVRDEQRRLMSEFFAALDSDYRRARPALLSGGASFPKSQF
jgi:hypothetical protein